MPPPSFIATVVLAAVVLALAIARIRSQRRLSKTAKTYQRSQQKLNTSLDALSDAVSDFEDSNATLVSEASQLVSKLGRREASADERYAESRFGLGCPNCDHSAYSAYQDSLNPADSHVPLSVLRRSTLPTRWESVKDHESVEWGYVSAEYESAAA